jgi:hypothetical protein
MHGVARGHCRGFERKGGYIVVVVAQRQFGPKRCSSMLCIGSISDLLKCRCARVIPVVNEKIPIQSGFEFVTPIVSSKYR